MQNRQNRMDKYTHDDFAALLEQMTIDPSAFPIRLQEYNYSTFIASLKTVAGYVNNLDDLSDHRQVVNACLCFAINDITELDPETIDQVIKKYATKLSPTDPKCKSLEALKIARHLSSTEHSQRKSTRFDLPEGCYLNFAGAKLDEVTIHCTDHTIATPWINLENASLANCHLNNLNWQHANLRHCNLQGAYLDNIQLSNADITGVDLEGAEFQHVSFFNLDTIRAPQAFSEALDSWFEMMENHPQLSLLRRAMAEDLVNQSQGLSQEQRNAVFNTAYHHPCFEQHQDLTLIRGAINNVHGFFARDNNGRTARCPIQTNSQSILFNSLGNQ